MKALRSLVTAAVFVCLLTAPAGAAMLSETQKAFVDAWLTEQGLNPFGDHPDTMYLGGSPLFDEATGEVADRYAYVLRKHPQLLAEMMADRVDTRSFGILPEIFSEEIDAALSSADYGRVCELVYNLNHRGPDAIKMEAEHLFALGQQLRFRLMEGPDDKTDEVRTALGMLEPILDTLKV